MIKSRIIILKEHKTTTIKLQNKLNRIYDKKTKSIVSIKKLLKLYKKDKINIIFVEIKSDSIKHIIDLVDKNFKNTQIPIIYLFDKKSTKLYKKLKNTNHIGYLYPPYKKKDIKAIVKLGLNRYKPFLNNTKS